MFLTGILFIFLTEIPLIYLAEILLASPAKFAFSGHTAGGCGSRHNSKIVRKLDYGAWSNIAKQPR